MQSATVNIPLSELMELQRAREVAELEASKLREQLRQETTAASDQVLLTMARAGIEVMRFAVANLPPESTKGWPLEAMRTIATNLPLMPGATIDDGELSVTLASFAKECEVFEQRRRAI
jgi:hypothetical protein